MTTRRGRQVQEETTADPIEDESTETQEEETSIMTSQNVDPTQFAAFLKWNERKDNSKAKKTSVKNAVKQLIERYPDEYAELLNANA